MIAAGRDERRQLGRRLGLQIPAGVLYAQLLASLAAAAPPTQRTASDDHHEMGHHNAVSTRLDLSAPPMLADRPSYLGAQERESAWRPAMTEEALSRQPVWRGDAVQFRDTTAVQALVRGMHRNGLPLVRLWQARGALFSLGLNSKGKPGLWFNKQLP